MASPLKGCGILLHRSIFLLYNPIQRPTPYLSRGLQEDAAAGSIGLPWSGSTLCLAA